MKQIVVERFNGKWYFNGELYVDLSGIEKRFVDDMLAEVKLSALCSERTPNSSLKRHNYKFN